jgi:hypothetical protein
MFEKDKLYVSGDQILVYVNSSDRYGNCNMFELLEEIGENNTMWGVIIDGGHYLSYLITGYTPLKTNRYWNLDVNVKPYEPQETSGPIYDQYIRLNELIKQRGIIPVKLKTKFIM